MALTNWNDILNKPKGIDEVPEIALTVEQLSASVLSISEDVGEIAEDVQEIALEVSNLSASTLPYSDTQSTKQKIDQVNDKLTTITPTVSSIDITSATIMDNLPLGSTELAWINYSGAPFTNVWATVRTFGTDTTKNQEFVCYNGYAFRHYENNSWAAWTKVAFS